MNIKTGITRLHAFPTAFAWCVLFTALAGCGTTPDSALNRYPWRTLDGQPPIIIAHRGDSGHYPEHTLAGYESALNNGTDFVEPDVVMTKDGVPVCRHDLYLSTTTDVASRPEFANRRRVLGDREDWFVFDFTLAELKTLRAIQHMAGRGTSHDGQHAVPTLAELIALVDQWNRANGGRAGVLVEIKDPASHRAAGLDVSRASHEVVLRLAGGNNPPPIIYQCFDRAEVERLAARGTHRVDWLTGKAVDLDNLPKGIGGLGLNKSLIEVIDGRSSLIDAAHERGLRVNCWTFRDDRMPAGLEGTEPAAEIEPYLKAGLDGVITDFPETGIHARQRVAQSSRNDRAAAGNRPLTPRILEQSPRRYPGRYGQQP